MTNQVAQLPLVTEAQRAAILAAPRTTPAHKALLAEVPAMALLEAGGAATCDTLGQSFRVVAWNVERCLSPSDSAQHLAVHGPDVVLLSEMDSGMARTAQCNTSAEMAAALGMTYLYGVEFHELGLGGETELAYCTDRFNTAGWHGNAILSRVPITRAELIRLDTHGHWFVEGMGDPAQPRLGGRIAIIAEIDGVCFATTHLESNADAAHRHAQFKLLLDKAEEFAGDLPILIGGDLNTGNHLPPDFDWRRETLFDHARARGFDWSATAPGTSTRPSLITPHPTRKMTLDWLCCRGLTHSDPRMLSSLDADGRPLSDHDAVMATFQLA